MVLQLGGLGAPAGAGPARGAAGVVVPAVCGACAVVGGLGVLGGRFFARAGRGFVSSEIKCNVAMSRPIWQEVAGHSGLAECCFEIPLQRI